MKREGWYSVLGGFFLLFSHFIVGFHSFGNRINYEGLSTHLTRWALELGEVQAVTFNFIDIQAESAASSIDPITVIIMVVVLVIGIYVSVILIQSHRKEQKFQSIAKKVSNEVQGPLIIEIIGPPQYFIESENQAITPSDPSETPPQSESTALSKKNEYSKFPETEIFAEKFNFSYLELSKIMQTVSELFPSLKSYFQENLLEYLMEMKSMSNKEIFALLSAAIEKISEEDLRTQLEGLKSEFDTLEPVGEECETLINKIQMLFKYIKSIDNRELVNNLSVFLILIKSSIYKLDRET